MSGRPAVVALGVQAALAAGCRVAAPFECERDEQCRSGEIGRCEPTGFCSFADASCPSGQRYHEHAGQYSGVCTPTESPPDAADAAAVTDAPGDAVVPVTCPGNYGITLAGETSRYRRVASIATFWAHHATCNSDRPGATHLVILDSVAEANGLRVQLPIAHGGGAYYVGAVQDPTSVTTAAGWIHLDGTPVMSALWAAGAPNDDDGTEFDHDYQVAYFIPADPYLQDYSGAAVAAAICECDGKPVAALAQQYIDTDPRNPN